MDETNKIFLAKDLNLGDVVVLELIDTTERVAQQLTVVDKTKEQIKLFRPFVSLANFTYTGGVLHYLGFEYVTVLFNSPCRFRLIGNIYTEQK